MRASILFALSFGLFTSAAPAAAKSSELDSRGSPFWWLPSQQNGGGSSSGTGWSDGSGSPWPGSSSSSSGGSGSSGGSSSSSCSCAAPSSTPTSTPTSTGSGSWSSYLPFFEQSSCSLSNMEQPSAQTPLPAPTGKLVHVALGRGTQNYTCDLSNSTAVPVQVGALATLYNATCLAATHSSMLSIMPSVLLNFAFSESNQSPIPDADSLISGHHFFTGPTNPTFGMDTANWNLGISSMSKAAVSSAPESSTRGGTTSQQEATKNGNVPWLYLTTNMAMPADEHAFSEVYRLNTIGGQPPSTCAEAGQAVFEVQYAAEYWLYV